MENISTIEDFNEEMAAKYLKPICSIALPYDGVSFFKYKGVKYMVGQIDNEKDNGYDSYLISYDDKGEMKVACTFYDKDYFQLESDTMSYIYKPQCATIGDKITGKGGQLIYLEDEDNNGLPYKIFGYNQWNLANRKELLTKYLVTDYPNPEFVLNYMQNRRATGYTFTKLGGIIKATKSYVINEDNEYFQYKERRNDSAKVVATRSYTEDYMKSMVEKEGFNSSVPDDLIKLYKGELNEVIDMQNITNAHIRSMNK